MSTTLREVIEAGGYDLSTLDDAQWLISKESEFDELVEQAEELVEAEEARQAEEDEAEYEKTFPKERQATCSVCGELVEVHYEGWLYDHGKEGDNGNCCGGSGRTVLSNLGDEEEDDDGPQPIRRRPPQDVRHLSRRIR